MRPSKARRVFDPLPLFYERMRVLGRVPRPPPRWYYVGDKLPSRFTEPDWKISMGSRS